MWIFDGEEWIEEGGASERKPEPSMPRFDEFTPELQVIEIVPTKTRLPMPPFPLP